MYDMYKPKPKKVVDPNAPPRPNLLNHEKRMKEYELSGKSQEDKVAFLTKKVEELERKLTNQTSYLSTLHQHINRLMRNT
jgi:uncharacterized coiled-coil protein SlyX